MLPSQRRSPAAAGMQGFAKVTKVIIMEEYLGAHEETGQGRTRFKDNPKFTLQLLIINYWNDLNLSIEAYNIRKARIKPTHNEEIIIRARLKSLLFTIAGMLKRDYSKKKGEERQAYDNLIVLVNSSKISEVFRAIDFINVWLDDKRFTRLDVEMSDKISFERNAEEHGF